MILVAYRHGLRASELMDLRWDQVDFHSATLHVRRVRRGSPSTHPILGDELRALRRLQREQEPKSAFVFTSERGSPFTTAGFARMVERTGVGKARVQSPTPHTAARLAGSHWPPRATTPAPCRPISGTRISSTRFVTRSYPPHDLTASGGFDRGQMAV